VFRIICVVCCQYQIRAALADDLSVWANTNWFNVSDAPHYIEVDWRAATSDGANDGGLTLWIDGTQQADLTGVDNDTWRVDRARLGALSAIDAGTSGTYYLDVFESRRSTYIGPMAQGGGYFVNYRFAPPLQSGSLTFTPLDDAYIESAVPTANYGTDTEVQVDNSPAKNFLLKFDVTGVNSQTVTNAKLCLYNTDGANAGGKFYSVTDNTWQEETVTWSNAPTAGTTMLAELGAVSPNTWYEVEFTSHITADGTYSLRVSNSTGGADYTSKEGANDPKLLVAVAGATPQSCSGTATATPTSGATNTPTQTPTAGPSPTPTNTSTPTVAPSPTPTPPAAFSSATFVYDGDGKRVKSTFNGTVTTYFVGAHYEVANGVVTKYYYAGAQRIAMRTNGTLNFLIGDHLGSTSLTTSATGTVISELRYKAWGEVRYSNGTTATKYQYTGQYSYDSDFGLHFYNARWYDPSLGRFAQADTFIPGGVQGLDRYAYVNNSPINYTDPSGHTIPCEQGDVCGNGSSEDGTPLNLVIFEDYTGSWSSFSETKDAIEKEALQLGTKLASTLNRIQRTLEKMGELNGHPHHYTPEEAFLLVFSGPVTFTLMVDAEDYAAEANYQGGINVYLPNWITDHSKIVIHELFHRLENILGIKDLPLPVELRRNQFDYGTYPAYNGFNGGQWDWQFTLDYQTQIDSETLADMGLGWATNKWGAGNLGTQRKNYMESLMTDLLVRFIP